MIRRKRTQPEPQPDLFVGCKFAEASTDDVDDLVVQNANMVHLESLDDGLATLLIYGFRGTDDFVQIDLIAEDGKLRMVYL